MILDELVCFSNFYGSRQDLVLAGGGNTSAKEGNILYIKASGTALATITADGFVKMNRTLLSRMSDKKYPDTDDEREAEALKDLMAARLPGEEAKRPSVETTLHSLFPQAFVLHLHPALVNGLTCALNGEQAAEDLFGDDSLWISLCKPGYILAMLCGKEMERYRQRTGKPASTVILQNHGIFVAADTVAELDVLLNRVLTALEGRLLRKPDLSPGETGDAAEEARRKIAGLYGIDSQVVYDGNTEARRFAESEEAAKPLLTPFTPDHIVYCKAFPVYAGSAAEIETRFAEYRQKNGYAPKIVLVKGLGFFAAGAGEKEAKTAQLLFNDAIKIAVYSESFGGALPMSDELVDFIVNWEVEAYRQKQN